MLTLTPVARVPRSWNFAACFVVDKEGNVVERSSKLPASCEAKIKSLL